MAEPLKHGFGPELVGRLADAAIVAWPAFDRPAFVAAANHPLDELELKDRVNHMADTLRTHLPEPWDQTLTHLVAIADAVTPDNTDAFGDMAAWPVCAVVERHGLGDADASLCAMEQLTQSFSCEFAIRPFLTHHLDTTLRHCRRWTTSTHASVRRLASEGTRPHLPWGTNVAALLDDPELGLSLIADLRHDPDDVVRRSVANHLNDVARRHPDRVVEVLVGWTADGVDAGLIRHALRSLVKKGNTAAMALLGFATEASVDGAQFAVTPEAISLGEHIELAATFRSTAATPQRYVVDFVIHHVNADGATSAKVFKWATTDLGPGESATLTKRRRIATASTRRYYSGTHRVDLQVAGSIIASAAFELLDSSDDG